MWCDIHSHPQQLEDARAAMERAVAGGVDCVIAATEKPSESSSVLALKKDFPKEVHLAAGLHPATAIEIGPEESRKELEILPQFLGQAVCIGEIGLDYKYAATEEQKSFQLEVLKKQLAMASENRLPVQLHSRRAQRQAMEAAIEFTEETGLPALLHWFTHSKKLAGITNEKGIYVSAGPAVLRDEATAKVVSSIDLDYLLLETDCPVPIGGRNEPANVVNVARKVAEIHNLSMEELAERMKRNVRRYLPGRTG